MLVGPRTLQGDSVHAWDEAVAFYTGSAEGTAKGGSGAGYLYFALAQKRCKNFGTCTADDAVDNDKDKGYAQVNSDVMALFNEGEASAPMLWQAHARACRMPQRPPPGARLPGPRPACCPPTPRLSGGPDHLARTAHVPGFRPPSWSPT